MRNRISKVRQERGLTLVDLATRMGVHWTTVARHQSGRIKPSPKSMRTYAEILECEVKDLFLDPQHDEIAQ